MKAENIKVGEWVVDKKFSDLVKVLSTELRVKFSNRDDVKLLWIKGVDLNGRDWECPANHFRRPTIADLNKGDVFEWEGTKFTVHESDEIYTIAISELGEIAKFPNGTKVRTISLASEKVGPERKTATVWINCYDSGVVDPHHDKATADAHDVVWNGKLGLAREACVQVTVPWSKGEGLGE